MDAPLAVGILVFDGVEDLDFTGPWEAFNIARVMKQPVAPYLVGETAGPYRTSFNMEFKPTATFADAPPLDVVMATGGPGSRDAAKGMKPEVLSWLKESAAQAKWITSVCAGSLILAEAGLLEGKRATTHKMWLDRLRGYPDVTVVDNARYVHDGNVVTSEGVTAGIDLAFYLLGLWFGPEVSRKVQRAVQYAPEPPFPEP